MSGNNQPVPFPRGRCWHNTGATVAEADYKTDYEGVVGYFADQDPAGTGVPRSPRDTVGICVRNVSAAKLLPKYGCSWAAGYRNRRVDGMTCTTNAEVAGYVDELLPSGGVEIGDLFWLMVSGRHLVKNDLAGGETNVISEGTVLVALTAATSGATTAGRVAPQDLNVATTVLGQAVMNKIGRAISATTTANTNADVLVELDLPY
jgi:hypothetical protein